MASIKYLKPKTLWGESLVWDESRERLYFVDCAAQTLNWCEGLEGAPSSLPLPSTPTGLVLRRDGGLSVFLADGVHRVNPDIGSITLWSAYPVNASRMNDACADHSGNLIAGHLGLDGSTAGACWQLRPDGTWLRLFDGVGNFNGPAISRDGTMLVYADTPSGSLLKCSYNAETGTCGEQSVFATLPNGGLPDGGALDAEGHYWTTNCGHSALHQFSLDGDLLQTLMLPVDYPSSLCFAGERLNTIVVSSIAVPMGVIQPTAERSGALIALITED